MTTTIHWFRRDLRLEDNPALGSGEWLIPLFILDETLLNKGQARVAFLADCLRALDRQLRARGSALVIRRGQPAAILYELAQSTGASRLTFNRDYSPYARKRDQQVVDFWQEQGWQVETFQDLVLHEFVLNDAQQPMQVFSPYRRRWEALPKPTPQPDAPALPPLPPLLETGDLPSAADLGGGHLPEAITHAEEAPQLLEKFMQSKIENYHQGRDRLDWDGTSRLSAHLRWGTLSIRRAYAEAAKIGGKGPEIWISELAWRDFYHTILAFHPHVLKRSFRPKYEDIQWENNEEWFGAWCEARTGYPVVDAAMRQLKNTGWMHNRARMIVASFLCKDLLIDWRWGEAFFMQHLLDGDSAANNGGWQWAAGTGTDAAPYFRIFNPTTQSQKFDPDGAYIRRWLPELSHLPNTQIHSPWEAGIRLDYPPPLVKHNEQRQKALAMYGAL